MLKGTELGMETDFDGNFAIRVPKDSQLVIIYVGYEDYEYEVKKATPGEEIVIALEPDESQILMGVVSIARTPMSAVDADIYMPD